MDREAGALPRSSESRASLGHRPGGRCPHCWMGMVRRPFRAAARATSPAPASLGAGNPAEPLPVALDREARFGDVRYPIYVRSGDAAWEELTGLLRALRADRFLLVTDGGVPALTAATVGRLLEELAPVTVLRVPAGERAKNLSTVD